MIDSTKAGGPDNEVNGHLQSANEEAGLLCVANQKATTSSAKVRGVRSPRLARVQFFQQ